MSRWDQRYAEVGWAFGTEPNDFLRQEAHRIPLGRVLCLGEGEGRNAVFLAKQGFEVVGVDQSGVGMEKAQDLAREEGVSIETVVSPMEEFDLQEGEWEGIVSIFFHPPPDSRRRIHRAVMEGLTRNGVLILEAYSPKQLELGTGGPPHLERLPTLDLLREELEGLDFVVAQEAEREVREGRMHTGRGSVVQVVGIRQ
ncbi:class I SAM-dependent methyltransferase [Gemmatimonadota bacterium]